MSLCSAMTFIGSLKNLKTVQNNEFFAACVLKLLDKATKTLVFDLLVSNLHISSIKEVANIKDSLNTLLVLGLVKKADNKIYIDPQFRETLLSAFCFRSFDKKFIRIPETFQKDELMQQKLCKIANDKITIILEFISSRATLELFGVKDILYYCDLIDTKEQITNKGFEFLFLSKKDQLWHLIINSIKYYSVNSLEESELLLDLMEIALKRESGPYFCSKFLSWYALLDSLGVIHIIEKRDDGVIFYTNNAALFDNAKDKKVNKFIILETNFKIYAYTKKFYEKSVLSLFSTIVNTFPDMIKACFDEESILRAFNRGITAKQIEKYLYEHSENVPRNVVNQINIWEQKMHRIKAKNGYLYHDFIHLSDFQRVLKFVESKGGLIHKDEHKRLIIGEENIHPEVKEFISKFSS